MKKPGTHSEGMADTQAHTAGPQPAITAGTLPVSAAASVQPEMVMHVTKERGFDAAAPEDAFAPYGKHGRGGSDHLQAGKGQQVRLRAWCWRSLTPAPQALQQLGKAPTASSLGTVACLATHQAQHRR